MEDLIRFKFDIKEVGIAVAKFLIGSANDEEEEFELTNICDPIGDLLRGLVQMLQKFQSGTDEENIYHITWYNDNECFNWALTLANDGQLNVQITESNSFFGDEIFEAVNTTCSVSAFIKAIVTELDSYIKRVGLLRYLELWGGNNEFPITYLIYLKKYLMDIGQWPDDAKQNDGLLSSECQLIVD